MQNEIFDQVGKDVYEVSLENLVFLGLRISEAERLIGLVHVCIDAMKRKESYATLQEYFMLKMLYRPMLLPRLQRKIPVIKYADALNLMCGVAGQKTTVSVVTGKSATGKSGLISSLKSTEGIFVQDECWDTYPSPVEYEQVRHQVRSQLLKGNSAVVAGCQTDVYHANLHMHMVVNPDVRLARLKERNNWRDQMRVEYWELSDMCEAVLYESSVARADVLVQG